jgi:hypothetical protein
MLAFVEQYCITSFHFTSDIVPVIDKRKEFNVPLFVTGAFSSTSEPLTISPSIKATHQNANQNGHV